MATNTTRLALRKPVGADDVDVSLDLAANYDKLDAAAGAITCTSSARPSSPFNGMIARESDTGNVIRYNGTTWDVLVTSDPAAGTAGLRTLGTTATSAAAGNDSRITGAQQMSQKGVASGYAGLDSGTKVPIAQLPTGTTSSTVVIGNDSRLSDSRTPTAHAASHGSGGSDPVTPAAIGAATSGHTHSASTPVTLTDAATVALDASLGDYFRLSAGGDRTIGIPSNAVDGKQITIEILASAAARTITLTTGSTGSFIFGTTVTALTQTVSGKRDLIRAVYNSTAQRWLVLAYAKGF